MTSFKQKKGLAGPCILMCLKCEMFNVHVHQEGSVVLSCVLLLSIQFCVRENISKIFQCCIQ